MPVRNPFLRSPAHLFKKPLVEQEKYPVLAVIFNVVAVFTIVGVLIPAVVFTYRDRGLVTRTFLNNGTDLTSPAVTCSCNVSSGPVLSRSCFSASNPLILSHTIVQIPTDTAAPLAEKTLKNLKLSQPDLFAYRENVSVTEVVYSPVSLERLPDPSGVDQAFSRAIAQQHLMPCPADGVTDAQRPAVQLSSLIGSGIVDVPPGYLYMEFQFRCTNCSACSPAAFFSRYSSLHLSSWVSIGGFGAEGGGCGQSTSNATAAALSYYTGRVVVNSGMDYPFFSQLREFLIRFQDDVEWYADVNDAAQRNITRLVKAERLGPSAAASQSTSQFAYVRLNRTSLEWFALQQVFPNMATKCSEAPALPTYATQSSVCCLFRQSLSSGAGSVGSGCYSFSNVSECNRWHQEQDPNGAATCLPRTQGPAIPQYGIKYVWADATPLMVSLSQAKKDEWQALYASSVCSNEYRGVLVGDKVYAVDCQKDVCWLTGLYNTLTDAPGAEASKLPDNEVPGREFLCRSMVKMSFRVWAMGMVGSFSGLARLLLAMLGLAYFAVQWATDKMSAQPPAAPLLAEQMELVAMQNNSMYNALATPSVTGGPNSRFSPGALYTALSLPARIPKVKFSEMPGAGEEELLILSPRGPSASKGVGRNAL